MQKGRILRRFHCGSGGNRKSRCNKGLGSCIASYSGCSCKEPIFFPPQINRAIKSTKIKSHKGTKLNRGRRKNQYPNSIFPNPRREPSALAAALAMDRWSRRTRRWGSIQLSRDLKIRSYALEKKKTGKVN